MSRPNKQRILVVDPDPAIRSLVMALLRRDGYSSDEAASADAALEMRRGSNHAAVVVLEPRMPGGEALLETLTTQETANVIVMTTSTTLQARYAATPGVCAVLLKPFFIDALSAVVASCCDGHEPRHSGRGEENVARQGSFG